MHHEDQKGVFVFVSNTCTGSFCSMSGELAVSCCDERVYIPALLQGGSSIDQVSMGEIVLQSAVLTVVMRHIAAQSVQSSTERARRGWVGVQPPPQSSLYLD